MQYSTRNIPYACFVVVEEENIILSTAQMMSLSNVKLLTCVEVVFEKTMGKKKKRKDHGNKAWKLGVNKLVVFYCRTSESL